MKIQGEALFFGAPTRDQAKRIAWEDLKLLALPVTKKVSESELQIKLISGTEIWVLGFDVPERFEGKRWKGGILTEVGSMKETVVNETVMPAMRDTNGWLWLEGVPEGKNFYYELSQYAKLGDPEWRDYCWFTSEVLDPIEVEKERGRLDERTFRQEYEGSFESYEGRAYVYYVSDGHRKPQPYDDSFSVSVCCDFNLDPCIWLLGQDKKGFISVQEEIKQRQTDVWKMCNTAKERLNTRIGDNAKRHHIIFYGDYEHGKTRSVSATNTSWQIIRDEFQGWNVEFRLKTHPRIVDRVNAVNSKLRSADGKVKLGLDPSCIDIHKDLEMVDMKMLQSVTEKAKAKDRTHASDALGYWIEYEFPVIKMETSVM